MQDSRLKLHFSLRSLLFSACLASLSFGFVALRASQLQAKKTHASRINTLCEEVSEIGYAITREGNSPSYRRNTFKEWLTGDFRSYDIVAIGIEEPKADLQRHDFTKLINEICSETEIESLDLSRSVVSDADIEKIASRCHSLNWVSLESTSVTDAGVISLATQSDLVHLNLCNTQVTGRCFRTSNVASTWLSLATLELGNCQVDDSTIGMVLEIKSLCTLDISRNRVTYQGLLKAISNHPPQLNQLFAREILATPQEQESLLFEKRFSGNVVF